MATIIIQTANFNEAKEILSKVYEADRSAIYAKGRKAVHSSSIFAEIEWENKVVIKSGYYNEFCLREMFDNE